MSNREFREADAAVDRAVNAFVGAIEGIEEHCEAVARAYIRQRMLRTLSARLAELLDSPGLAAHLIGPAEMKLSNALADYRDARFVDRGGPLTPIAG